MKNKKILIPVAVILSLALLLVGLEKTHVTNFIKLHPKATDTATGPTPAQSQEQASANAAVKQQLVQDKTSDTPASTPTTPSSSTIELSTRQESNGTVTVFTKLPGVSNGSCSLKVTNGAKSTSQTAAVIYQPEYSTCAGFSVPVSSVGTGTWALTLTVTSNGTSASKSITSGVN